MIILAAVDNANGLLFNHRRVTRDRVLRRKILAITWKSVLWMDDYSAGQFQNDIQGGEDAGESGALPDIRTSEHFLDEAQDGDFCFVEDRLLMPYKDKIESFYLFHWNRDYPSDFKLDFVPQEQGFHLAGTEDFPGYSHDDITMEVWEK